MEFEFNKVIFYVVAWLFGFGASTVRILLDHDLPPFRNVIAGCLAGGFFSFGFIAILLRYDSSGVTDPWFYLGIATLAGLLGKEQEKYSRLLLAKVFRTIGILDDDNKNPPS